MCAFKRMAERTIKGFLMYPKNQSLNLCKLISYDSGDAHSKMDISVFKL